MKIGIIGLGYVGMTFAFAATLKKQIVYGIEVNPVIRESLQENKAHFFEPGLDQVIQRYHNKTFFLVDEFTKEMGIDAFIMTVGTPLKQGTTSPNFDYIKSALNALKKVYTGKELVILRSTVSVGTTRNIVIPYLCEMCGKEANEIRVAYCPERTVEGKAIEELQSLPQIISGNNAEALKIAEDLFREITPFVIKVSTLEAAEMVKLVCNTYRDMHFALGNVLSTACQALGVDGTEVIRAANTGYDRSKVALPGFVGGPCLEKDAYIMTENMKANPARDFILSARKFNESLEDTVVDWAADVLKNSGIENGMIAISGMAFKGVPPTSDLRGSNSVNIARKLRERGYSLKIHDFCCKENEMADLQLGEVAKDLEELVNGADLLLILNNNRKYAEIDFSKLIKNITTKTILDTWNCICEERDGIYNLGNMYLRKK